MEQDTLNTPPGEASVDTASRATDSGAHAQADSNASSQGDKTSAGGCGNEGASAQNEALADDQAQSDGQADGDAASPADKIAELEQKLAALNDQYLRKAADFDNYRKRSVKDKADAIDFANQSLLLDLIPILDDFDRALTAAKGAIGGREGDGSSSDASSGGASSAAVDYKAAFTTFLEGIAMTENRLYTTLENKWGLKRYASAGEPFDPQKHEALMMEKSPDATDSVVQEEFVKGYTLKDRVVRTAKVKVLMPE